MGMEMYTSIAPGGLWPPDRRVQWIWTIPGLDKEGDGEAVGDANADAMSAASA